MAVIWKYREGARRIIKTVYKFCMEKKQSGLNQGEQRHCSENLDQGS